MTFNLNDKSPNACSIRASLEPEAFGSVSMSWPRRPMRCQWSDATRIVSSVSCVSPAALQWTRRKTTSRSLYVRGAIVCEPHPIVNSYHSPLFHRHTGEHLPAPCLDLMRKCRMLFNLFNTVEYCDCLRNDDLPVAIEFELSTLPHRRPTGKH